MTEIDKLSKRKEKNRDIRMKIIMLGGSPNRNGSSNMLAEELAKDYLIDIIVKKVANNLYMIILLALLGMPFRYFLK